MDYKKNWKAFSIRRNEKKTHKKALSTILANGKSKYCDESRFSSIFEWVSIQKLNHRRWVALTDELLKGKKGNVRNGFKIFWWTLFGKYVITSGYNND